MPRTNEGRHEGSLDYLLVFALIYISANPIAVGQPALYLTGYLAVVLVYLLRHAQQPLLPGPGLALAILTLMSLLALNLLPLILDSEPNASPYLAAATFMIVSLPLARLLSFGRFAHVYVNVASTLAATSLVLYAYALIEPSFVHLFPVSAGQYLDYRNAFIHVFLVSRALGTEGTVLNRNNGLAWEPGAYQILLNLALLFAILRAPLGQRLRGREALRMALLAICILSTASFTGMVGLGLLLMTLVARQGSYSAKLLFLLGSGLAVIAFATRDLIWTPVRESTAARLRNYSGGESGQGVMARLSIDRLHELDTSPLSLFGSSFSSLEASGIPIHNSVLQSLIVFGVPFTLILLAMYWNFASRLPGGASVPYLLLMITFMTENYFRSPLFLYLAYAALVQRQSDFSLRPAEGTAAPRDTDISSANEGSLRP